jgi:hypothetical protein
MPKGNRKIVVRQQIVLERIIPISAWDDSSVLTQAEGEFKELLEPILEELAELGLSARLSQVETFVVEGGRQ